MAKTYENLLREGEVHYKSIKNCYCPVLKADVVFNSKGFHHFKYDGLGHMQGRGRNECIELV